MVKGGDKLDLGGGHVLEFVMAPNLHWPGEWRGNARGTRRRCRTALQLPLCTPCTSSTFWAPAGADLALPPYAQCMHFKQV